MPDSPWTETGTSISLVPTTTTIDPGSSPENVNYLTNSDKIALMQQYSAELAMKTQLDTTASSLSIPSTNYDNAVANINTTLVNAGAPSNWATIWPDGTTSGPWNGIQNALSGDWSAIASARASLQSSISEAQASQQAAAAQSAAIAAAATSAASLYATLIQAPAVVSSLPALPNSNYPNGKMVWNTGDNQLYQNNNGTWQVLKVDGTNIFAGSITAGQIAAGAIGASQIAAGAITTQNLTVADTTNLCENPSWVYGATAWDSLQGQPTSTTGRNVAGSLTLLAGSGTYAVRNSNHVPCNAGDTYYAEAWFSSNGVTSGGAYVRLRGLNASGTEVWTPASTTIGNTSGAWTLANVAAAVPSGVVTVNLEIVSASPVGANISVADCFLRRMTDGSLIVDGSITASKIAAGAITASMITSGTLDASLVNVTNLNASNIVTGTLSATKVLFPDGSELSTANRVQTLNQSVSTATAVSTSTGTVALPGLSFSVNAAGASDVFNLFGMLSVSVYTNGTYTLTITVELDGATETTLSFSLQAGQNVMNYLPLIASLTGLSAGAHTIALYAAFNSPTGYGATVENAGSYVMLQRIY